MAKKKEVKERPNLIELFRNYMTRKSSEQQNDDDGWEDIYGVFNNWWEDEDDGFAEYMKSKYGKKNKHKKNKKKQFDDDDEYDFNFPDTNEDVTVLDNDKKIYFYYDYHYEDEREEFDSIEEFNEFCESMGYFIPDYVIAEMFYGTEFHCCIYPSTERDGTFEVACELSYGELFFEVCDNSELE